VTAGFSLGNFDGGAAAAAPFGAPGVGLDAGAGERAGAAAAGAAAFAGAVLREAAGAGEERAVAAIG